MQAPLTSLLGYRLKVEGLVQGVGFRPSVVRVARQLGIVGEVRNGQDGVYIDLLVDAAGVARFIASIEQVIPSQARVTRITTTPMDYHTPWDEFTVQPSLSGGGETDIPADKALCDQCRAELLSPQSQYCDYAFVSCNDCGPRYTMITAMPYDRSSTAMAPFALCETCQRAYQGVSDRRFHTQASSCTHCGPTLEYVGDVADTGAVDPLAIASKCLEDGQILAIKGLGGFHLSCDGLNDVAIARLRQRKQRPDKPLALMMADIDQVSAYFALTATQAEQLTGGHAPIVLLPKSRQRLPLPDGIAPRTAYVGVMLAYTPLHLLLLKRAGHPLVMTSGNRRGAPLCIDNQQALQQLEGIADGWLMHDRTIVRACDDSVVQIIDDVPRLLRRARGYVPEPLPFNLSERNVHVNNVLAMGGDVKNVFAMTRQDEVILSAHNGDLGDLDCYRHAAQQVADLTSLLQLKPQRVVIDKHPDYLSARLGRDYALRHQLPLVKVQHHHAHLAACLVDNGIVPQRPILGIVLDGMGYGDDGTVWGAEVLLADFHHYERLARLKPFPLLGGEKAHLQPWRNLLALLDGSDCLALGRDLLSRRVPEQQQRFIDPLLGSKAHSVLTSSAGRLFDAVAALLNVAPAQVSYEGQAAMQLEALATHRDNDLQLPLCEFSRVNDKQGVMLDPGTWFQTALGYLSEGLAAEQLVDWFHQCFVASWVNVAQHLRAVHGCGDEIALSGGVFQNQRVLQAMTEQLRANGFTVYTHRQIPCNDGGLAAGQAIIAAHQTEASLCA